MTLRYINLLLPLTKQEVSVFALSVCLSVWSVWSVCLSVCLSGLSVYLSVCLSVCLSVGKQDYSKNACVDLDEMLRVDRCRDMDELVNF